MTWFREVALQSPPFPAHLSLSNFTCPRPKPTFAARPSKNRLSRRVFDSRRPPAVSPTHPPTRGHGGYARAIAPGDQGFRRRHVAPMPGAIAVELPCGPLRFEIEMDQMRISLISLHTFGCIFIHNVSSL